jgi:hypothetical protein
MKGLSRKKHTTEHRPNQQHNAKDSKPIQNISKTYPRHPKSFKNHIPDSADLPSHRAQGCQDIGFHTTLTKKWHGGMVWDEASNM